MLRSSLYRRLLVSTALLPVSCAVAAQDGQTVLPAAAVESAARTAGDPLAMTSLWQLTLGMLLVLGLILAMAWLLKRTGRFQMSAGGSLRILGGLSMGSRERVVLIQAGDKQLLLGVAPGRVQTLHVLDQPLTPRDPQPVSGFAEQLGRMLGKDKVS